MPESGDVPGKWETCPHHVGARVTAEEGEREATNRSLSGPVTSMDRVAGT